MARSNNTSVVYLLNPDRTNEQWLMSIVKAGGFVIKKGLRKLTQ